MTKLTPFDEYARDGPDTGFYLPAAATSSNLDRFENIVDKLFEFHGVVLIPDTYNE